MAKKELTWPAWFNNADGTKSAIFEAPGDVPKGWTSGAEKIAAGDAPEPEKTETSDELDAEGHAWDPELHVANKKKTQAGLWRMKPGVSRPAPKSHDL